MLSLPDDWDYSIEGLTKFLKDGRDRIKHCLTELESAGYLVRTQRKAASGRFSSMEYTLYESPQAEKPLTENPSTENPLTEKPLTENPIQLNTKELNTEILNTKELNDNDDSYHESYHESSKQKRHKYGQYDNVLLSDDDLEKLKAEFPKDWQERIERLSEYMASSGKSYKSHLATIRCWAKKDTPKQTKPADKVLNGQAYTQRQYTNDEMKRLENRAWLEALADDE